VQIFLQIFSIFFVQKDKNAPQKGRIVHIMCVLSFFRFFEKKFEKTEDF
jgi:hypothetical protein